MPRVLDYRTYPFNISRISDCGKHIGKKPYWRLYSIENVVRSIVHSVLSIQIGPAWWTVVIDPNTEKTVQKLKQSYAKQRTRSSPGKHDIYYLYLSDLSKIMAAQSNLFLPIIPDIDTWILKLESIRLPRNIVGHMNWLNDPDEQDIGRVYLDFKKLLIRLSKKGFVIKVP